MKNKQILIVSSEFPPQPGGIGAHAYNLAHQLHLKGYRVHVLCDQRSPSGKAEALFDGGLGFEVHRIPIRRFRPFMYVHRLLLLLRLQQQAHVVLASGKFSLWSVGLCSLWFKKVYIAVVHGTEVNFKQRWLRYSITKALQRFATIIAVSRYTKSLLGIIPTPVVVIPNGYDPHKWDAHITASTPPLIGMPKLVTVGNVTERKGQHHVIAHLPQLVALYPRIHYHCIGIPTQEAAFTAQASTLGVADHVTFHGRLDDSVMQATLLDCDVMLMLSSVTSTGDVEGFGIALLEANALGLACIGSKGCGIEDAIQDGHSGVLIDYDDTEALVKALADILSHKERYALRSKAWAAQHEWQHVITHYQLILDP